MQIDTSRVYTSATRRQVPRKLQKRQADKLLEKAKRQNLTSLEVCHLTGATNRQLQWWDEQGLIVVPQKRHSRIYSPEDTRRVGVVVELRKRGISLQLCRKLMKRRLDEIEPIVKAIDVLNDSNFTVKLTAKRQRYDWDRTRRYTP